MATGEDNNFNTAYFGERSMAQMLLGRALNNVSASTTAAAAEKEEPNSQAIRRRDEGLQGENLVRRIRNVEKRGLMNIDLNVAPPEDADSEFTAADGYVSGSGMALFDKREPSFDKIAGEVGVEVETKKTEIRVNAEAEMVEKSIRRKRWVALLEFAENALVEKEEENRNRKRRASHESELSGEPLTRRRNSGERRRQSSEAAEWNGENEVAAVVRSSRGRAVAMPNKYRDSVLGAVAIAEAELPRRNKSGKSATVFSKKRKSR